MAKYKVKEPEIEAIKWDGSNINEIQQMLGPNYTVEIPYPEYHFLNEEPEPIEIKHNGNSLFTANYGNYIALDSNNIAFLMYESELCKKYMPVLEEDAEYLMNALAKYNILDKREKALELWKEFSKTCCDIENFPVTLCTEKEVCAYYMAYKTGIIYDVKSNDAFTKILEKLEIKSKPNISHLKLAK